MTQNVLSAHFTLFAEVTPFEVKTFELETRQLVLKVKFKW